MVPPGKTSPHALVFFLKVADIFQWLQWMKKTNVLALKKSLRSFKYGICLRTCVSEMKAKLFKQLQRDDFQLCCSCVCFVTSHACAKSDSRAKSPQSFENPLRDRGGRSLGSGGGASERVYFEATSDFSSTNVLGFNLSPANRSLWINPLTVWLKSALNSSWYQSW